MKNWVWRGLLGLAALWLVGASAAEAGWRRAESEHFIVYGEEGEERLRQRAVRLEIFHDLLEMLTGTASATSPNKLPIYLVRSHAQMSIIRDVRGSVGGFYSASPGAVMAVVNERADAFAGDDVLYHEYAHHFMMQYRPGAYPAWWVEGFAEYVMTARIGANAIEFGNFSETRVRLLTDQGAWIPLDEVLFGDTRRLRGADRSRFYSQSWILVHYWFNDEARRQQLLAYLSAIGRGEDPREAFRAAFATDMRGLEDALRYYSRRMTFTRLGLNESALRQPVTVTALPDSANDLLLPQAALRLGQREPWLSSLLARIRRAAAGRDDLFARRVLAQAEILYGDSEAGEPILEALLRESPEDAELLYLKGMRFLRGGRGDPARRAELFGLAQPWFVRAHRADPNHVPTLFSYAESLSAGPTYVSENTANILLLAHRFAPQVGGIGLQAGYVLHRLGRNDDAVAVLAPIAAQPHGGRLAERAQALLDQARSGAAPAAPPPFVPADEE